MKWEAITGFFATVGIVIAFIKSWVDKIKPYVIPLIEGAEEQYKKAMADGVVTCDERKEIVMSGIAELERVGKIKLNFITRFLIGKAVDYFAKKLPPLVEPPKG